MKHIIMHSLLKLAISLEEKLHSSSLIEVTGSKEKMQKQIYDISGRLNYLGDIENSRVKSEKLKRAASLLLMAHDTLKDI